MMLFRTLSRMGFCLLLLSGLAACGDLPEPFLGNPGATARRLAQPPTPRLAVPPPGNALLADAASQGFAQDLASALQAQEVPAVAQPAQRADWRLVATAESRGGMVVPVFSVVDPKGTDQGKAEGAPVPAGAWAAAAPDTLRQVAGEAAPKIASLLTGIQVAREKADPNSLYNRPARVMVADVTGAPGDGNVSLTKQMRTRLALLGPVVQTTANGADFTVQGQVKAVPIPGHQQRIEIQWIITDAKGDERGRVVQLNEIPAGTLDRYWGDVAVVVATEASGGISDVLKRQTAPPAAAQPVAGTGASPQDSAQATPEARGQGQRRLVEGPRSGVEQPVRQ